MSGPDDPGQRSRQWPRNLLLVMILASLSTCADCGGPGGPDHDDEAAATSDGTPDMADHDIMTAIQNQYFFDGLVPPTHVDVNVDFGVVTLDGTVDSLPVRDRAVAIAGSVRSVRAVVDQIRVKPPPLDDATVLEQIERILELDCVLDPERIDVQLADGAAKITGSVESWSLKILAERVVASVRGVRSVDNGLLVTGGSGRSDGNIRKEVEKLLLLDPFIDNRLIEVDVSEGRLLISGALGSAAEISRAEQLAQIEDVVSVKAIPLTVESIAEHGRDREDELPPRGNDEIVLSVMQALDRDARIPSSDVNAQYHEGTLMLTGIVRCLRARRAATADALQVGGVMAVENRIAVRPVGTVDDVALRKDVETALDADAVIGEHDVNASVSDGTITLSGTLNSMQQRLRATDVAARLRGVVAVVNDLRVKQEGQWKEDHEIEMNVREEIFWNYLIDESAVQVNVSGSIAVLSGHLDSWQQVRAAVREALDAGAVAVESVVEVGDHQRTTLLFDSRDPEAWRTLAWPPVVN
jgi:osmotically-inducible protein OsmY